MPHHSATLNKPSELQLLLDCASPATRSGPSVPHASATGSSIVSTASARPSAPSKPAPTAAVPSTRVERRIAATPKTEQKTPASIVLDLANNQAEMVRITPEGWEIISGTDSFERPLLTLACCNHALPFDRVSALALPISDSLCRLSSGAGFSLHERWDDREALPCSQYAYMRTMECDQ